jgi:hypothetical protein
MWFFYQNKPSLGYRYKSAERKISEKKTEYVKLLTPCHVAAVKIWARFDLY